MDQGIPYADIVILALVAGFILLRLRGVLGQKSGNDNPQFFDRRPNKPEDKQRELVVQVAEKSLKPKPREENDPYLATLSDKELVASLNAIKTKDPLFTATTFLDGARMAFEMVFDAFAKGDKTTLKMLLADDIYQHFAGEIETREKEEQRRETTLVAITLKALTKATLVGNNAKITVKFVSEQIALVRDKENKIVEGDPSEIHQVEDEWVFERDVTSKNPNWKIIET